MGGSLEREPPWINMPLCHFHNPCGSYFDPRSSAIGATCRAIARALPSSKVFRPRPRRRSETMMSLRLRETPGAEQFRSALPRRSDTIKEPVQIGIAARGICLQR